MVQRLQPGGVYTIPVDVSGSAGLGALLLPASGRVRLAGYTGMRTKLATKARYGARMSDPLEGSGSGDSTG